MKLGEHEQSFALQYRHLQRDLIQVQLPVSIVRETLRAMQSTERKRAALVTMACCADFDTKIEIDVISEAKSPEQLVSFDVWHCHRSPPPPLNAINSYSPVVPQRPRGPIRMGEHLVPLSELSRHLRCPDLPEELLEQPQQQQQPPGLSRSQRRRRRRRSPTETEQK